MTYHEATCNEYYDSDFLSSVEGFPAYIYPTQSSEFIQKERLEAYAEIIKTSSNPPRGLAYYEEGFMCALLDGHHKACATSMLGKIFHCLTIIAPNRFWFVDGVRHVDGDTYIKSVSFAGISVEVEQGTKYKEYCPSKGVREKEIDIPIFHLTGDKLLNQYWNQYPTMHTLSGIMNAEIDMKDDVVACAKTFISSKDEDQVMKLDYLMKYLSECGREEAYVIAKMILDEEDDYFMKAAQESAIKEMLKHPNEETEQYMMNYLVNHNSKDPCWYLVNSYWN